jgi:hypothetical protein
MTYDLHDLIERVSATNQTNGFSEFAETPEEGKARYLIEKLWLVNSELTEAGEELREGHGVHETYFEDLKIPASLIYEVGPTEAKKLIEEDWGDRLRKPEGFPSEIADAIIRLLHLVAETGIDIEAAIEQKLAYNATRGHKHGGKKF